MWINKVKWMVIGMAITGGSVWIYNNRQIFSSLSGSHYNTESINKINPEFANYISAFTSGYISSTSCIKVKLTNEQANVLKLNSPLKESYFSFEPSIEGITVWKDAQTLEFRPNKRLESGKKYKSTFRLHELVDVKDELKEFVFNFQTIQQAFQFETGELKSYSSSDFNFYSLAGTVSSADYADPVEVEKTVSAALDGNNFNLKWIHDDKNTNHSFLIDSIKRPSSGQGSLKINCNTQNLNIPFESSKKLVVSPKEKFELLNAKVENENDQYLLLNFSNPVDPNQSLESFIELGDIKDLKFIINNNQVLLYPNSIQSGSYTLTINENVKDAKGQQLRTNSEHHIVFNEIKPSVKFSSSGSILPSTNKMSIPFETVNLMAVDVKIIRIYENNILQFLQQNELDGGGALAQVGKKIIEKRINLGITNHLDFRRWKKFSLDISSLIQTEPGAIYRVYLGFRKNYATYACLGNSVDEKFEFEEIKNSEAENEVSYFGYYYDEYSNYNDDEYDYDDGSDDEYSWRNRDNPCKEAYYRQYERTVTKNILASDVGLTLKKGNDGSIFIAANDLISTQPLSNVTLELYDYQKQLLHSTKTNNDGQAFISIKNKVSFVIAKKDEQRAFLRLDDGATLPLSMYDVSGDNIKKGIKGFIYGERGVWRPGDTLFLNFILEDKLSSIPSNHPVIFELTNPQGQIAKRIINNKSVDGFYNFTTFTDKNAPSGLWNAEVRIGTVKFNKSIRIEAIMPNRLKVEVKLPDNNLIDGSLENNIALHSNWLTGAAVHNLPATIDVALSSSNTFFDKYKEYHFDDQTKRFDAQNISLFKDKLDENGNANIPLKFNVETNAPGFLKASFTTRVYEEGGAFSVDRFSVNYSPYSYYTGIKLPKGEKNSGILYTNEDHVFEIATVDAKGKPTSRSNLKFELIKLEWRWWWDQYNDELANYASDTYHKSIISEIIQSKNGMAKMKVKIKENEWGRYLVRVTDIESGHSATAVTYFDWSNWMDREGGSNNKIISNMLSFTTDKATYKTGEEAIITIPSPQNGRALVTIENGSRVLEAHWLETEKGSTFFKFKIKPEMAPNVYVHVSLMQPHSRSNDLPIRLFGVAPITIDDPETHLRPLLNLPAVLIPEQNVTIKVSEENKKEMAFTLAVVDEGLLDITRFKTPNPWNAFYSKEALGVKTWDVYDQVIGAFGADLERILSIGGDGSEIGDDGAKANRFKPMVRFFGPYHLSKNESKEVKFKLPMYVGSVRVMLVACNKGAYGTAEKTVPVKAPLMVLGTLPRVLSVTEEVKLPISVFGGDKNIGNTSVKIEANEFLQILGDHTKTISVGKDDEKILTFNLRVKNKTGIAKVKISANGGGHEAKYEIELDVRNPNPYQTSTKDYWLEAGKSESSSIQALGIAGTNTGVLELSNIPSINLEERLNYLISYPHGCIEQTTSQALAQLYLSDILELSDEKKADIERNIKHGINEIKKFQLNNGSLSYWQGSNEKSDWGSSYACHFLALADKKGYTIPSHFKKNLINYQYTTAMNYEFAKSKGFNNDVLQAYRLYTLAIAKQPALSAMNRLREFYNLSNQARWLLASAYAQVGQINEAEKLISAASTNVNPYSVNYYTYGSTERDHAIILQTLCLINKKSQAYSQLKKVSEFLSSKSWMSTQTTAYGLLAVSEFIKKYGGASALQVSCKINGKSITIKGNSAITQIPIQFGNSTKVNYEIINQGKGTLYARIINKGKPSIGNELVENQNIAVSTSYKDMAGNNISPTELLQGENFMLVVNVKNLGLMGELKNLALSNYMPSGWEIHNSRMEENESPLKNWNYTYQDIKDDRVFTYFDLKTNESKTFTFLLNASYSGKYYLPAVNVEAMYDKNVYARTKGQWIQVVKQKRNEVASN